MNYIREIEEKNVTYKLFILIALLYTEHTWLEVFRSQYRVQIVYLVAGSKSLLSYQSSCASSFCKNSWREFMLIGPPFPLKLVHFDNNA